MISQNTKEKIRMIAECIRCRIRNYCVERKLSLYAFAQGANISYSTLRDFMNEATEPKLGTLVLIAEYMGISLSELVKMDDSG
ncbi:MAG: helix-turn-helix transcriptional regulator [Clostridiales bacterium]|nr:helix-turn-helix transcriptional regulator [Clostridiales bacterium]